MLNPFFQQGSSGEQSLVQDLINEQLKIYGIEIYYIPRKYVNEKTILREVVNSKFDDSYPIEAYVDTYEGYDENPTLLSKFGIQQTNEVSLVISQERFENYIAPLMKNESDVKLSSRPKEGDLIYFPLGDRLFEIKYVEHEKPFYQLQKNYVYTLKCELFRYGNEIIDTGIEEIDDELVGDELSGISADTNQLTSLGVIQSLTVVGVGNTADAVTTFIESGSLRSIKITNRGSGYTKVPTIGISSAPSGGVTAVGIASMIYGIVVCNDSANKNAGSVQAIDLTNPGSGYTTTPLIKFVGGYGSGAAASAIDGFRTVGIVTVSDGGSGFSTAPTVTFSTPIHVGAAATSTLDTPMVALGVSVASVQISAGASNYLFPGGTTGGAYYKTAPSVVFALPDVPQTVATATVTMGDYATTGGTVANIAIATAGSYYAEAPTISISGPVVSLAAATISIVGESINPSSIAFSTTGRAYRVAPTVAITTSGFHTIPTQNAVGVATIHPITGIVTAVSFDANDPWSAGTGATIGAGYTQAPGISFSGITAAVGASATAILSGVGTIQSISIGSSGFGYAPGTTATASIASGGTNTPFRATGIATIRFNSIKTTGTIGIGSTVITGIGTTNIIVGDRVRLVNDYDKWYNFIPENTFVSGIGTDNIVMSNAATNVGIATSSFEFGIDRCGIVTGITLTYGGGGYLTPPEITIENDVSIKNYHEEVVGVHTARGVAVLDSSGSIESIRITDAGAKYVIGTGTTVISVSISNPPYLLSSGNFEFNEVVTGSVSGATGRVRVWDVDNNILELGNVAGTFVTNETVTGSNSGATNVLRVVGRLDSDNSDSNRDPVDDYFADNKAIEKAADAILDFSEQNPFGIP